MLEFFNGLSTNIPAAVCLVLGILLVGVEVFIPGFGIPGITGVILLILGIILGAQSVFQAFILIVLVLVVLAVMLVLIYKSAKKGRIYRSPLVLKNRLDESDGFSAVEEMENHVGRRGVTLTPLHPAGTGDFGGMRLDIVSDSEFIEKGRPVRIVKVEGRRIVVRELTQQEMSAEETAEVSGESGQE